MKFIRSTKCSLKFATEAKRAQLREVLSEYGPVVNFFLDRFWSACPSKAELLKPVVDLPRDQTWLTARLRKVAAREAIDMIQAAKERWGDEAVKPTHRGKRMCVSSTIARLEGSEKTSEFDGWLLLRSIGRKIKLDLPIRSHKHFERLLEVGKRQNAYIITDRDVQFSFEIETEEKLPKDRCVGLDTGINTLATLSTGEQLGTDIKAHINRIRRCQSSSKGQKRAIHALKQRIDEVAKETVSRGSLVVVENLTGITIGTKKSRRLHRSMRATIGKWNVRYWLDRLQQQCEWNRVSFRTVSARYTSQRCFYCGHVDRGNRKLERFKCVKCGHLDHADKNAARNILHRFLTGPYGAGCKPLNVSLGNFG